MSLPSSEYRDRRDHRGRSRSKCRFSSRRHPKYHRSRLDERRSDQDYIWLARRQETARIRASNQENRYRPSPGCRSRSPIVRQRLENATRQEDRNRPYESGGHRSINPFDRRQFEKVSVKEDSASDDEDRPHQRFNRLVAERPGSMKEIPNLGSTNKGAKDMNMLSEYCLLGRDQKAVDILLDHPSCSEQHAALQFDTVSYHRENGSTGRRVRSYIIDLESANGTFVNNNRIEPRRHVKLKAKDVLKFGFYSCEYEFAHEAFRANNVQDATAESEDAKT